MSDQLTAPPEPDRQASLASVVLQFVVGVVVIAGVGALAGIVWYWVWTPTVGIVVNHQWLAQNDAGLRGEFTGTGWYVVVGTVAGLVAGALVAVFLDRVPLVTLAAVALGSTAAAWLMVQVGTTLGPSDPRDLAAKATDGVRLPAQLTVSGHSPWIALPAGALLAFAVVFIGWSHRQD